MPHRPPVDMTQGAYNDGHDTAPFERPARTEEEPMSKMTAEACSAGMGAACYIGKYGK